MDDNRIYKEFDKAIHIIPDDQLVLALDWQKFRSIDFGYIEPFVCIYLTIDTEDRVIIYDEYYQTGKTTEEHAKILQQKLDHFEYTTCAPSESSG